MSAAAPSQAVAGPYPVDVTVARYPGHSNRLSVLFRWILAIPVGLIWGVFTRVFEVTTVFAWIAILFTGRFPPGLFNVGASIMRLTANYTGYTMLVTDEYPPWTGDDPHVSTYPVQYSIVYPGQSNRLTVFFRAILAIPALAWVSIVAIAAFVAVIIGWFVILITGRYPEGLRNFVIGYIRLSMRVYTYLLLMTDRYPPFGFS